MKVPWSDALLRRQAENNLLWSARARPFQDGVSSDVIPVYSFYKCPAILTQAIWDSQSRIAGNPCRERPPLLALIMEIISGNLAKMPVLTER
jgi:hypothetical protein